MPKRRQNGEGTIYQRANGLWVCELTLGYDETGKRLRKTISSMELDKLKKKINDTKYLKDRDMIADPCAYTVSSWVAFWLENYKKSSVKPATYNMYYESNQRYITPKLGHYKLDKLTPVAVQKFVNDLSERGIRCKDGLAPSSVKKIYLTLSQAYKQAVALNLVYKDPCGNVKLPKEEKSLAAAFTEQEQARFLSLCDGAGTFTNLFIFAFYTGLRIGELLALTWEDFDDEIKNVLVNKNIATIADHEGGEKKTKTVINTAKTQSGMRVVPLHKKAAAAVRRQRENNHANAPFVFYSAAGTPVMRRNAYRAFLDLLQKAQITSHLTLHSMRHSFATRLLEKGADIKTISELMGHKSIQITLDTYAHVSNGRKKDTVELL